MRFLDSKTHGILDYLSGALIIAAPWLFGFAQNGPETWVLVIIGLSIIVMSIFTSYELGLMKMIPLKMHLGIDVISGIFLMASPWLLNFSDYIIWPHLLFGALEVAAGLVTKYTTAQSNRRAHVA